MIHGVLFDTERLLARRLSPEDAKDMVAIFGDQESMRFVGDSKTLTEADCLYWIVDVTDKNFESRGYGMIAFVDKDALNLIGCAGVFHPGQQTEPEVMYWIQREQWGKGFATEIVKGLVAHARDSWMVERMIATIHPDNLASQRVITKSGFVRIEDRVNEDGSITQVWERPGLA